jgi:hypothetical protein
MVELKVYIEWNERKWKFIEDEEDSSVNYQKELSSKKGIRVENVNIHSEKEFNELLNDVDGYMDEGGSGGHGPILITTKDDEIIYNIKDKNAEENAKEKIQELLADEEWEKEKAR